MSEVVIKPAFPFQLYYHFVHSILAIRLRVAYHSFRALNYGIEFFCGLYRTLLEFGQSNFADCCDKVVNHYCKYTLINWEPCATIARATLFYKCLFNRKPEDCVHFTSISSKNHLKQQAKSIFFTHLYFASTLRGLFLYCIKPSYIWGFQYR